ncbi:MAG: hypothetical protein COW16_00380 [Sphingomonadales bacterium CG12_big_fil_rev_8_21_14_0_65_65_10]|nr:MAG: hypothetical protein COW16_00380 [Sphingomonadales bacterium CG12_big_fil_rev_8_21_14_0_65_65_10]
MRIFGLAAFVAASLSVPVSAQTSGELGKDVDAIAAHFSDTPIIGMTIAVSRGGRIVFIRGYGHSDLASGTAAGPDTVYEIGSITKEFTAAAILRLVERGRLRLDAPIHQYFPELTAAAPEVTLSHLLSHTSGLSSERSAEDLTAPTDPEAIIAFLASRPAEFQPGEKFRYNNNGYNLLGLLIERASGTSWQDYMEREFFAPLALESTHVCAASRDPRVSKAYRHPVKGSGGPSEFERHHPSSTYAAGAICSTAADLLRWQEALVSGEVVGEQSVALMATPRTLSSGMPAPYGLGLFSDDALGEPHLHHGGASSGFITQLGYFPQDGTGIVVLTNGIYAGAIAEQIEQSVLRVSRGEDAGLPINLPLSPAERAGFAGTYDLGPVEIEVYEQDGVLRAQPGDQVSTRLLYQGEMRFIAEHDPQIEFIFEAANGQAAALTLRNRGRAMPPAKRVAN